MYVLDFDFSEIDNRAERMELLHDGDVDAYFGLLEQLRDERTTVAKCLIKLAEHFGCVVVHPKYGMLVNQWYFISPSFETDGLRYTAWDERGPVWHGEILGEKWLEKELPDRGFTVSYKAA